MSFPVHGMSFCCSLGAGGVKYLTRVLVPRLSGKRIFVRSHAVLLTDTKEMNAQLENCSLLWRRDSRRKMNCTFLLCGFIPHVCSELFDATVVCENWSCC